MPWVWWYLADVHVHAKRTIDATSSLTASVAARLEAEIERVVIGQEAAVHAVLLGILAGGRCLLTGPSGVGKSALGGAVAGALGLPFVEVPGTPEARETPPVERAVVVFDEIARTPPSIRVALLDQDSAATVVLATHNPQEHAEWPLSEAELDRFMLSVAFDYPTAEEERELLRRASRDRRTADAVVSAAELSGARSEVAALPAASNVIDYAARLARSTRPVHDGEAPAFVHELVANGAGPRGALALMAAARAHALIDGGAAVSLDDVDAVAPAALRHRLQISEAARRQRVTADDVIARILPGARV